MFLDSRRGREAEEVMEKGLTFSWNPGKQVGPEVSTLKETGHPWAPQAAWYTARARKTLSTLV